MQNFDSAKINSFNLHENLYMCFVCFLNWQHNSCQAETWVQRDVDIKKWLDTDSCLKNELLHANGATLLSYLINNHAIEASYPCKIEDS